MSTPPSDYFSIEETVVSQRAEELGIQNVPTELVARTIIQTARYMDNIRRFLGFPIHVNSWYRSPDLCIAIGSKATSQHTKGEAVDWTCPGYGTPEKIASILAKNIKGLHIDQLILEHGWIHTSFAISPPRVSRYEVLSLLHSGGYSTGLTDIHGKAIT
jgi:zinc D-Ala-D-Ala carboxypeptidase